jgi:hypothetical protein
VHGLGVAAIVAAGVALVSALLAIRMPREATVTATEGRQPEGDRSPGGARPRTGRGVAWCQARAQPAL